MSSSFDPTGLIAGTYPLVNEKITVLEGQTLVRGTVIGRQTGSSAASAAKTGGNTGNGTLTLDVTTPVKAGAKAGVYAVVCIAAAANNGTFRITDPDGFVLGDVVMAAGAGAFDNDIKFALADGSSDFIVGDGFDVTVSASGKWKKALSAATDGSAVPRAVLAFDVDAADADVVGQAYFSGEFAKEAMTFGTGHTMDTVNAAFRANGVPVFVRQLGAAA